MGKIYGRYRTFRLCLVALAYFTGFCPHAAGQCTLRVDPASKQDAELRIILSKAAAATSALPADITKARLLERVARILWAQNEKAEATGFFECALAVAAKVTFGDVAQTRDPFASIDLIFDRARAGDSSGALLHVGDFPDAGLQNTVRGDVACAAAQRGEFELAEHVLQSISEPKAKDSALTDLAMRAGGSKQFAIAERAARAIGSDVERVQALSNLAVNYSRDGQSGHASQLFSEAVDIAKQLSPVDESGAPQFWAHKFNTRDTMLGFIAIEQLHARLDSEVDDTYSLMQDLPARAQVRHVLAIDRDNLPSSESEFEPQTREIPSEGQPANSSPAETARRFASTGNYGSALSFASELDFYDRVSALEEIAQTQVGRGDAKLALDWADRLAPAERAPTLLAIAEAILDR